MVDSGLWRWWGVGGVLCLTVELESWVNAVLEVEWMGEVFAGESWVSRWQSWDPRWVICPTSSRGGGAARRRDGPLMLGL